MPLDGTTTPTTEIILGAIERLERHGWCQGRSIHGAERCVFGAIRGAAWSFGGDWSGATCRRFERANGITQDEIAYWNDEPERTKEEVIEALRRAL
jgi:hypothetical protein